MKRILYIGLLYSGISLCSFLPAQAQITVDGDASEWTGAPPSTDNTSVYRYNTAGTTTKYNEWIWKDAAGDNRTDDFGGFVDGSKQDILEIRLASDGTTNLYFLLKLPANIDKTPGDGAIQLQISIRRGSSSATEEWLANFSDTKVPNATIPGGSIPDARWDYLIYTRIEGSVPWSDIGGAPTNEDLIFTFSVYRANTSDGAFDTGGDNTRGNCLDFTTSTSGNTYNALIGFFIL